MGHYIYNAQLYGLLAKSSFHQLNKRKEAQLNSRKGNAKNSSMERIKILCYAIDYFVAMYKYTALEYIYFFLLPSTTLILFHTACYFLYFILYIIIIPLLFICLCSVFFFASYYSPCDFVIHSKKSSFLRGFLGTILHSSFI